MKGLFISAAVAFRLKVVNTARDYPSLSACCKEVTWILLDVFTRPFPQCCPPCSTGTTPGLFKTI